MATEPGASAARSATAVATDAPRPGGTRLALVASIGTMIEFYDFLIFATAASLVFNTVFFPVVDPLTGTLLALLTFGAGFLPRVLGALLAGHYGDRFGRKRLLVVTLVSMGLATFLVGLLPGYAQIGVWAPIALLVLRLVQGLAAGGEWGGAALVGVENAPTGRRVLFGSWSMLGAILGAMLATATFALLTRMSPDAFVSWGWRLPFVLSVVLVAVGLAVRVGLDETREFAASRRSGEVVRAPIMETVRTRWREVLLAVGVSTGHGVFAYLFFTFSLTYGATALGLSRSLVLTASMIGLLVEAAAIVVLAAVADRIGAGKVVIAGFLYLGVYSFLFFPLLNLGTAATTVLAMALGYLGAGAIFGPIAGLFADLFPPAIRYTGLSVSYQMGSVVGGGLTPTIAIALYLASGEQTWPIAVYTAVMSLIGLGCCAVMVRRSARHRAATGTTGTVVAS